MPSAPPPQPPPELLYYTIRSPWQWVMQSVASNSSIPMEEVESTKELPTGTLQTNTFVTATPNVQRRRSVLKKGPAPCTLRLEDSSLQVALHGTSAALDGLEDKDELVRTMQRCRCEHLNIGPPSILIKWDITRDELENYVPSLPTLHKSHSIAVLKEPMGSRGEGIYFVSSNDEAYVHIEKHRMQALEQPDMLDNIMNQKGRMPAWGMYFLLLFQSLCTMYGILLTLHPSITLFLLQFFKPKYIRPC